MKSAGRITYWLIGFTMLFATTACTTNKGSLHVRSTTMVGETQLPAGEYRVQWDGHGPEVELKIKRANRLRATVPAKVIPLDEPSRGDAAVMDIDGDGHRNLREIRLSGQKLFIQIDPPVASVTLPQDSCPECECGLP
jgi:hypothetical protein